MILPSVAHPEMPLSSLFDISLWTLIQLISLLVGSVMWVTYMSGVILGEKSSFVLTSRDSGSW